MSRPPYLGGATEFLLTRNLTSGSVIEPQWFALDVSRGLEAPSLKLYMRATVIASEYLTLIPAAVFFLRRCSQARLIGYWNTNVVLVALLMQPATLVIDHAHFQYNTVMLGFVVASFSSLFSGNYQWGCCFFVLALSFKQMALYFAPTMFAFLLGSCMVPRVNMNRLLIISVSTLLTFGMMFTPLIAAIFIERLYGEKSDSLPRPPLLQNFNIDQKSAMYPLLLQICQSIHRIFPFARGLFEDKVANVWCAIHILYKLNGYSSETLQRISLTVTVAAILPSCITVGVFPTQRVLMLASSVTAWGFFLLSFQVHEKSVLLPLLPMTLLLATEENGLYLETRSWVAWANALGAWTLFPLLERVGLRVPYTVCTLLWVWLMGIPDLYCLPWTSRTAMPARWTRAFHGAFYLTMIAWHLGEATISPPKGKPDIFVVANVMLGAFGFGVCYLWCSWRLLAQTWLSTSSASQFSKRPDRKQKAP